MDERPWLKSYDSGVPKHIEFPKVTLTHLLEESARKYPDRPCAIFNGGSVTYAQVNELSDRLAGALAAMGVKRGDPVGIFMPNTPQFVIAFFAILKAGGAVVATNPLYTPREIEHQMKDAGCEIMLVMSNFYSKTKEVQNRTRLKTLIVTNVKEYLPPVLKVLFTLAKEKKGGHRVTLGSGDVLFQDLLAKYKAADRPKLALTSEDLAIFQYSGGTTGLSKAAVSSHFNLVVNALQIKAWMPDVQMGSETVLMAIPLFHVYGMVAGMMFAISTGASMVMVPNPRDLKDVLHNIDRYHPSIFPGVPTMYNAINNHPEVIAGKHDLRSIKACISGSAPLMRETKERFEKITGGKLVEGYGLSEAPTATHCNPLYSKEPRSGSIGLPLPNVDCRIVSLDDGVTDMKVGEIGELAIRSPNVMKGYHNMPTETANSLRDGWLFTGDIARMDADGYFYIVDRKKELIKPGGYQVWPREVEEVITEHPKVLECGVAGIPDAYRGETVKAWVVMKPGQTMTPDDVRAWCKERLAPFKVPTAVEFRPELPKTTVGKILRRELVRQDREKQPDAKPEPVG
ncbi:MAG: long-chain fatty acid--CoA ligase [Armatimonadetes bacterium]|nr:long-chain fatty acid--CoA ligase [Armatimonadota bacterium]